ncbi:MAG: glycosyltransferase [Bryobacteraceae bacterium]
MQDVVILVPLFNDWGSAEILLRELDAAMLAAGFNGRVLIVDDCSSQPPQASFHQLSLKALPSVDILHLRRNLGHQRAIAVGLVYIQEHLPCRAVVVMDADGQDRPADACTLLREALRNDASEVIFAARSKRLESLLFRTLYQVYRALHVTLTGNAVRVGNFSAVPWEKLTQLVVMPELWHHYAAAVIRSRIGVRLVPIPRGQRLLGESRMGYAGLLLHGLSAFFVYGDIIGARLLAAVGLLLVLSLGAIGAAFGYTLLTGHAIPQWGTLAASIALIVLPQALLGALVLVFTVIGNRVNHNFLPIRDCPYFVRSVEPLALRISNT